MSNDEDAPEHTIKLAEINIENNLEDPLIKQEVNNEYESYNNFTIKAEELIIKEEDWEQASASKSPPSTSYDYEPTNKRYLILLKCFICNYKCLKKEDLVDHIKTHGEEEKFLFSCTSCNYKTNNKNYFHDHKRIHTDKILFECTFCDYKCKKKSNLDRHRKRHIKVKQFACQLCDYKCEKKEGLTRHVRVHNKEKRHHCPECDYKSARKAHLTQHLHIHSGEKPYHCPKCDHKYSRRHTLNMHMAKYHWVSGTKNDGELENNCASLKEEVCCSKETDGDCYEEFRFNAENCSEQVQYIKEELNIKEESLWDTY